MSVEKRYPRLLFFVGNIEYFISHRLTLALGAISNGYDVWVIAPSVSPVPELPGGIKVFFLNTFRKSRMAPWGVGKECLEILKAFKVIIPDILHNVGMKPIFLGSFLAFHSCGVVNDFAGLGYTFTVSSQENRVKKLILKFIFYCFFPLMIRKKRCKILCQNSQDKKILRSSVNKKVPIYLIPGSGIDMSTFFILPMPAPSPLRLLFAGRLLKEKGLRELVEAKKLLKKVELEILVCGDVDLENPSSFTTEQIMAWQEEGLIHWLGFKKELSQVYKRVHGAVLPSYREGLPRSLLEACAWGRPVITTQVPGCQDVVIDGVTGYLAKAQDVFDLARAIQTWADDPEKEEKGKAGHFYVIEHFSKEKIHPQIFEIYKKSIQ
ncbi:MULTISPECIES: glycosyltransferase family 4 protein [Holospora]|uniref:N, N'-diacetylbacillosaminyl-diphospho-undecaprenol alpha-1,3-N-acetylgalactosaminyltransferase n=2 Tax=Holospora TaxID=44747 RepID=A0A061JH94_9PROT|nr:MULTISPECIES: glycosyltransferase family 4 protein [Holospora]ETZ04647.1 N,N'-diacetylbacillosaminyl-diphospho-undecaprenol alpha-1,3-N-acetylgalactosaminyltransferase [Holospora undulata HU1]GAJ46561.1 N, N'-diacetylbacillosaminyl-diphospho-undecaprenol alpha-1,3-N-acetylgalactosaminyltransferase [Holospora elegans E1]